MIKALMLSDSIYPYFKHRSNSLGYLSESNQIVSNLERSCWRQEP